MPRNEELIVAFEREAYVFGEGPDRTIVGDCQAGKTVKGRAAEGALEPGITYRFLGAWRHTQYGKQFWFNSSCVSQPANERGVLAYLKKAPGIGQQRACLAYGLWGARAVEMIREQPDEAARTMKGLTPAMAEQAAEWLRRHQKLEAVTIDLTDLLGGRGFPKTLIARCIGKWGEGAAALIRKNPYVLMSFGGVGFLKADKLYLELGLPADSLERQAMAAWHALTSDMEGNTWLPRQQCEASIARHVSGANLDGKAAVSHGIETSLLREFVNGQVYLADAKRADSEAALAGFLRDAMREIDDEFGFPCYSKLKWPAVTAEAKQ